MRELRNFIEQTVLLAQRNKIDAADLSLPQVVPGARDAELTVTAGIELAAVEEDPIRHALEKSVWSIAQAAQTLRISRDTLRYRIEKYQLTRKT